MIRRETLTSRVFDYLIAQIKDQVGAGQAW